MTDHIQDQNQTPDPSLRFTGKVAVITGANEGGIGGAIAMRLAQEGADLHLLVEKEAGPLQELLAPLDRTVTWSVCDVTQPEDIARAHREGVAGHGHLDILVNNAGVDFISRFEDLADEAWEKLIDVNLIGVMRCTRAFLPELIKSRGVIVNVSSASGVGGAPGLVAYGATKAGVNGMTQGLAAELASRKVRVVGVAPALVATPMAGKHLDEMTPESWEKLRSAHPLGLGKPKDVAAAVAFLASEDARWISGVTLPLGWMPSFPLPLTED